MTSSDIAIVGMAIRCPGASNLDEFWDNLVHGVESISFFERDELEESAFLPVDPDHPDFIPASGIIDGHDRFDARFFGISRAEAEGMDPQHRLFLETAWEAMENSGHDLTRHDGNVSVYAGSASNTYTLSLMDRGGSALRSYQGLVGTEKDYLATRVSYKLGLSGESLTVQTACSTSLVAVHLACQSLLTGQSDVAIAGGVSVQANQKTGFMYHEDAIFSPDGHCRAFDKDAGGTVFGNGVAAVVLRPLDDALEAGDRIYAVIKGSFVNNDAAAKMSYTAPSVEAQAAAIAGALEFADVSADTIGFVEAHGTGTVLGDPIEAEALTLAFRESTQRTQFCALGSVKTNVGHLNTCAGVTGLIKTALVLHHGKIPATLHFRTPNPEIDFAGSPFFVNSELREWPASDQPRRAGVSSFGIGGTNAHAVLEEAPRREPSAVDDRPVSLLTVSARSESALRELAGRHRDRLDADPSVPLADYAFTANTGRRRFPHRLAVRASSVAQARDALGRYAEGSAPADGLSAGEVRGTGRPVVAFLFTGQSARYPDLAAGLYRSEPTFRAAVDRCAQALSVPAASFLAAGEGELVPPTVLFAVEYALAELWQSWGVRPDAVLGHSLGEYAAACVAGILELPDAIRLVAERTRQLDATRDGAMVAVSASVDEVTRRVVPVSDRVSISGVNGPEQVVISGDPDAVGELSDRFAADGIVVTRLPGRTAFHSPLVEPAVEGFAATVRSVRHAAPRVPFVSTLIGEPLTGAPDRDYWLRQLREPVLFSDGIAALRDRGCDVFLELGPHPTLTALGLRAAPDDEALWLPSLRRGGDDWETVADTLGRLFTRGVDVDLEAFEGGARRARVTVPPYPFERERYWIEDDDAPARPAAAKAATVATPQVAVDREGVLGRLREVAGRILRIGPAEVDPEVPLVELGLDSLALIEAAQVVRDEYQVKVGVQELLSTVPTLAGLADLVVERLPEPPAPQPEPVPPPGQAAPVAGSVEQLMAEQLRTVSDVIAKQLDVLRGSAPALAQAAEPVAAPRGLRTVRPASEDPEFRRALDEFTARYTARTRRSKELAAGYRTVHADNDNRFVPEFRMDTKELVYPIAVERSRGSRLWDVDGNEYVDLVMGMGVNLFGHSPDFVTEAVRAQLDRGTHVGVQAEIAGEVAALTCELTGAERVVFCNTGSEAVMTALRLARAVTGRGKVAMFSGSYHGVFDGTLVRRRGIGDERAVPLVPGVPPHLADDLIVVDYDDPASLDVLAAHGDSLAAVLVEPVQSRRPDVQPREFLHQLRELTSRIGAALIFDEMISGFRCDPGGAQAWFDVRADLVAYGKVLGGGLPIGAVAGRAEYLDAIDGGDWRYGDDSYPAAERTFFAGTFCKHPLAMAAAHAVLTELRDRGPELQRELNARTEKFVGELNAIFAAESVPITVARFGSLFRFVTTADVHLLYPHLIANGVHAREGRNFFLSTAHTDDDLDTVLAAVRTGVGQATAAGLLPGGRPARPVTTTLPLTPAQRSLWTLARLDPDAAAAYNQTAALRVRGPLDLDLLGRAVSGVVARHEALRTVFDPEQAVQTIRPELTVEPVLVELPAGQAAEYVAEDGGRPYDLANGPLLRVTALRQGPDDHILVVGAHHLVADGWSMGVLMQEIAAGYAGAELTAAPRFRDYVAGLDDEPAAAGEAYWLDVFRGPLPVLELPTDRPRPPVRGYRGGRRSLPLDPALSDGLRALAARNGSTLFMVLLAAYQTWLHRLTGQRDLVVGVPVAGRDFAGADRLIGPCANMVAVRGAVDPRASFAEHLAAVKASLLGAYEHQSYPFPQLVEKLGLRLDPARTPLVGTLFNLDRQLDPPPLDDLQVERVTFPAEHVQFDLSLNVVDAGALRLELDFSADLFDAATAEQWLGHFRTLLESVLAAPSGRLAELPVLSEPERSALLVSGPAGPVSERSVSDVFDEQAARSPGATAVIDGETSLTYAELAQGAERLAAVLAQHGAGPGSVVGVCLPRSVAAYVAILGVLRTGAAYVPLDPRLPAERLAFLVEDAGARVVVADGTALPAGVTVVGVDAEAPGAPAPARTAGPDDAAMVLYTSGSTGRPKGVVCTHRAVLNRLSWMWRAYPFADGEMSAHKTSLGFVDSVWELFGPLLRGVPSVVLADDVVADAGGLIAALADHKVTRLVVVPSLLRELLEVLAHGSVRLPALRLWTTSGEVLPAAVRDRFRQVLPAATLLNLYGSTEVMADATAYECGPDDPAYVPIGRPIDNVSVYVLDEAGAPVPAGVPGELYVGGAGVALGYLNRPEETSDRFRPDPFAGRADARMFRTGDLARWRPGGVLEFLGRRDSQVKVRGIRVEPGEVEGVLDGCPDVRQSAVVAGPDAAGDTALTAYVVAPGADPAGLRSYLAARLPDAAVPARIVLRDDLPHTASGKVDRLALVSAAPAPAAAVTEVVEARTPIERALYGIWTDVLGEPPAGVHADFVESGGNSLSAVRMQVRVQAVFGVTLTVRDLFGAPTVAGLAAVVEARRAGDTATPADPIPARPAGVPAVLSDAQQRLWFLHQFDPDSAALNLPFGFRLRGPLDTDALRASLTGVAERHDILRSAFPSTGGEPVQVVAAEAPTVPVVDLSGLPDSAREPELARLADEEARRPFDLATGPLLRATIVRVGPDQHVLLVTLHHIVADGWSLGLVIGEVTARYEALRSGRPAGLPELSVQYADFAAWQRERLAQPGFAEELEFWRTELADAPALLELPTDRPRGGQLSSRGDTVEFRLPAALAGDLTALGRRTGATPYMVLLAGFAALLSRYSGQTDVCVGTPVANRTRTETEEMVGCFVNTLVLRTDLSGAPSFEELVGRVRELTLRAFEHQEVPFERLVEELQPARDTSHSPLFQVMFILQNIARPPMRLPGLDTEPLTVHSGTSKYDLTLELTEDGDGLSGIVEFSTDLFDRGRIERMVRHLEVLLTAAVAGPDRTVTGLPVLTEAEHQQVVVDWNATATELPDRLVHEQFEEQAAREPDRIAVRTLGADEVGYGELNRRANRLARRLVAAGVGPEVLVGLLAERGTDYLTAMLAVAKAGGAYLPLDPQQPAARLTRMVRHSGCALVLADGTVAVEGLETVGLRELITEAQGEDDTDLPATAGPGNLAYVLYTSGSTGEPKGVMVEHGGMVNHVAAKIRDLGIGPDDVLAQNGPQSFDVSVWQFLAALTCGGRVEVFPDEVAHDPVRLLDAIGECGVTVLQVVPSVLRELVAEAEHRDRPSLAPLRWMVPTGDALMADLCERWFALYPAIPMLNTYGATECSDDQCHIAIEEPPTDGPPIVTIGRPIGNMTVYLLDESLRPVPVGVSGELYLGGIGVGRGYLADPLRTAGTFVPDPYAAEPGARMYRTHDEARLHLDGTIEFLGRTDNLVKVAGFRIEPGEIEAALVLHPDARDAVVVARADDSGHKRLVGYVGCDPAVAERLPEELRTFLRGRLPDYLVPFVFVTLDALPLNANGKVDRKALPEPGQAIAARPYVAPRTASEQAVAQVWSEVLGVDRVGADDGFFDLGGHSLVATRVMSRLNQRFGIDLPLRTMFEADTVAGLAAEIDRRLPTEDELAGLLDTVEGLTDDEVARMLGESP